MKNSAAPKTGSMAQEKGGTKGTSQQAQDKMGDKSGAATDSKTTPQHAQEQGRDKSGSKTGEMQNDTRTRGESGTAKPSTAEGAGAAKPSTAESKTGDTKSTTTTGNAATSATAAPPPEKQTQIVSAIKQEKVEEVTNVNFNISVGATVPATVHYHPLPARIVEIYPEWRGYDFILVRGKYVIVRPQTHEIVYIIEG
jgi:hypothetical protein